ncbi:glutamate receptor-like [Macrobrachium nipponense]|uniref:glutamate receptor-like n=1 Tax=Macrobrachium nipponense TaxID=159736 RepID=UPI0030C80F27
MMRDIAELGADFSTSITVNPDRLKILDKVRTIDTDWLCILSPQPQVLPRYLVITRTLSADVWIFLLVTITVWGVCLWGLQRAESRLSGRRSESFGESICYGWAAIVDHPPNPPSNLSGQVLVGWLLIGTLLISSCFKSSLVANLTVENKEKPIDSYEGLVKKVNWKWGVEKFFLTGAPLLYFSQNPDPVIQFIYNHTESMVGDLGLEKVRGGRYSFLSTFNRISYFLGVLYSDTFGRHPFYVSKSRYRISSDIGLGIRKGAPFLRRFSQLVHRLAEAGILSHWIKDVLQGRISEDRKLYRQKMKEGNVASTEGTSNAAFAQSLEDEREVVLKMEHFLGLYLVFLCGLGMAMITFLVELYFAFRHLGK